MRRPKHVSLAHYLPYEGIPHAGGDYVLRHLSAVAEFADSVAFVSSDGVVPSATTPPHLDAHVIDRPRWGRHTAVRALRRAARAWNPTSVGFDVAWSVRRSASFRAAAASADVIEFQYFEECQRIGMARRLNAEARTVAVMHDVVSQRLERRRDESRGVARVVQSLRVGAMKRRERKVLNHFDCVTVFTEKDKSLLRDLGVTVPVQVLRIPMVNAASQEGTRLDGNTDLVFVGAFDRRENAEAANWLLRDIWPDIRRHTPEARLVLAGANPTSEMSAARDADGRIEVTGFVDDLADVYRRARVVIVPLQHGAGLKFKTVVALIWGVPVVATSVGAEGIPDAEDRMVVVDDAPSFTRAVREAFDGRHDARAAESRTWALSAYGKDAFVRDLSAALNL